MRPTSINVSHLLGRLRMRQVALLLGIEKHGTLRAASGELGMTQSAATKMLQELEDALGHELFERVGRSLRLNPYGRCVTAHFGGLRGSLENMQRELHELHLGSGGKIYVGAIMAASPTQLTNGLMKLKKAYPLLAVEIVVDTSDRLMELLHEGRLDIVIGRTAARTDGNCLFRPLADEALSIIVSPTHPLTARSKIRFSDLLDFPWILQPEGSPMRNVIENEFAAHNAPLPVGLIETASILTTTNVLANTDMIAVIPWSLAERYQHHGMVRILAYKMRNQLPAYGSVVRRDRPISISLKQFMTFLHD
jgi:DNA-binding transcriptional LysR family regulator